MQFNQNMFTPLCIRSIILVKSILRLIAGQLQKPGLDTKKAEIKRLSVCKPGLVEYQTFMFDFKSRVGVLLPYFIS